MNTKEIWLIPYGGLGNRIGAVNSMLEFSSAHSIDLHVIWFRNFELNASFSSLFLKPQYPRLHIQEASFFSRFVFRSPRRNNLYLSRIIAPLKFDTVIYYDYFKKLREEKLLEPLLLSGGKILVETCAGFGEYDMALSRNFKPTEHIKAAVDKFVENNFSACTIGIHIRRTDNSLAIDRSPLKLFEEAIEKELAGNKDATFYVASDDSDTKHILKYKFGESRILTRDILCNRDNRQGIENAVEDMLILSRTKRIYGSFYSSFSDISAKWGRVPLRIIYAGQ